MLAYPFVGSFVSGYLEFGLSNIWRVLMVHKNGISSAFLTLQNGNVPFLNGHLSLQSPSGESQSCFLSKIQ